MNSTSTPHARPRSGPSRLRRIVARAAVLGLVVVGAGASTSTLAGRDHADAADLTFPFTTTFDDPGGGTLFGDASIGDGWLRLTSAERNQAGSWAMNDVFPSTLGLEIEFRYAMWGGKTGADGLLLALSDGSAPMGVGAYGASLGYVCSDSSGAFGACDRPGLPGGYLAVAFDRYGNFSRSLNGSGTGQAADHVVLRGAGDDVTGYRFLKNVGIDDGVATEERVDSRIVRITLLPNDSGHTTVTVRTTTGTQHDLVTVLDHVPIEGAGQGPLPETLRLNLAASTGAWTNNHEIGELSVWVPTDLRAEHETPGAVPGEPYEYRVRVADDGPNDVVGSEVRIDVPEELGEGATWTCSADGPGAACAEASGSATGSTISSSVDLTTGSSATYTIRGAVAGDARGELAGRAEIVPPASRADLDETNNVSRATIPVEGPQITTDKSVAVVGAAAVLHPGEDVEYTVSATNRGPGVALDVGVEDPLPDALAFAGSGDDCSAEGQLVTCRSTGPLEAGAARTFRFRATLDPTYTGDGSDVANIATGTSPSDPGGGDPSDPVVLPPVEGGGSGPTPEPTPDPTAGPTASPGPTDGATPGGATPGGPGSGGGDDGGRVGADAGQPSPARGALAFTGASGLLPAAVLAAGAVVAGALLARGARRRKRT